MSTLRAIRDLTERARQESVDATLRYRTFQTYADWAERYPYDVVLRWVRESVADGPTAAQRQAWSDILRAIEASEFEVIR